MIPVSYTHLDVYKRQPLIFPYVRPKLLLINNLTRDSIMRNGHPEYIARILTEEIPPESSLLINGDDLIACSVAPVSYTHLTFGCQMNEHDSEIMAGLLKENGYRQAASRDEANIVIFNTCSIRENADKRFFGTLGQLKHRKEAEKDDLTVCVCGCMMQQQHITDELKARYPWVDVVFGTHNFTELPKLLDNLYTEKEKQFDVWPDGGITEGLPAERPVSYTHLDVYKRQAQHSAGSKIPSGDKKSKK